MKRMKFVLMGGLVAAAAALTVTGVASADAPSGNHPLLSTTCSYDQVVAAMKANNPKAEARFEKHPKAQERLKKILAMTPADRQKKYDEFKDKHPKAAERLANGPKHEKARAVLNKALETCGTH